MRVALDTNRYVDLCKGVVDTVALLEEAEAIVLPFVVLGELRAGFAHGRRQAAALYIDVGIEDHARILGGNRRLHSQLDALGVAHSYTERPGGHAWEYIRDALPAMLHFVADRLWVCDTKPTLRTADANGKPD